MIAGLILLLLCSMGCASWETQNKYRKDLAAALDENLILKEQRDECTDHAARLEEALQKKPRTVTIRVPVPVKEIDPGELAAIKRQAFDEAEKKFKARVERQKRTNVK